MKMAVVKVIAITMMPLLLSACNTVTDWVRGILFVG